MSDKRNKNASKVEKLRILNVEAKSGDSNS